MTLDDQSNDNGFDDWTQMKNPVRSIRMTETVKSLVNHQIESEDI
jgi:hypothetical protein